MSACRVLESCLRCWARAISIRVARAGVVQDAGTTDSGGRIVGSSPEAPTAPASEATTRDCCWYCCWRGRTCHVALVSPRGQARESWRQDSFRCCHQGASRQEVATELSRVDAAAAARLVERAKQTWTEEQSLRDDRPICLLPDQRVAEDTPCMRGAVEGCHLRDTNK